MENSSVMKNNGTLLSIGIDVGSVNGAISVVDENLKIHLLTKTPTYQVEIKSKRNKSKINKETMKYERDYRKRTCVNFREMRNVFLPFITNKIIYTIEKIAARPGEGEPNSFMNGNSLGNFQGLYAFLNPIEYYEPLPITWKREMGVDSDKEKSIKLAEDIFQVSLRDFLPKGKVDDIAEALLLSFYGLKMYYNK